MAVGGAGFPFSSELPGSLSGNGFQKLLFWKIKITVSILDGYRIYSFGDHRHNTATGKCRLLCMLGVVVNGATLLPHGQVLRAPHHPTRKDVGSVSFAGIVVVIRFGARS